MQRAAGGLFPRGVPTARVSLALLDEHRLHGVRVRVPTRHRGMLYGVTGRLRHSQLLLLDQTPSVHPWKSHVASSAAHRWFAEDGAAMMSNAGVPAGYGTNRTRRIRRSTSMTAVLSWST